MQRTPLLIIPALAAIVLFVGISRLSPGERSLRPPAPQATAAAYDILSRQLQTVTYNAEGSVKYTLDALSQTRNSRGATQLEQPRLQVYISEGDPWLVSAHTGRVSPAADRLDFSGEVEAVRGGIAVSGGRARLDYDTAGGELQKMTMHGSADSPVRYRHQNETLDRRGQGNLLEMYSEPESGEDVIRISGDANVRSSGNGLSCAAIIYDANTGLIKETIGPCSGVLIDRASGSE